MSGHSKWSTIKRKKGAIDSARGKIFTKLGREIAIAVKEGGADINANARLRDCIAKAKANNMPNDTIQRNIKRFSGADDGVHYEENTYEGYAVGGIAVVVRTLTDNKTRTISEVRHAFDKYGNGIGATGSVLWMFERKGLMVIDRAATAMSEDDVLMAALEAGAGDVVSQDDVFEVYTAPGDFSAVRDVLEAQGFAFLDAEIGMYPSNTLEAEGETAEKLITLIEKLEDLDDVQEVFHNALLPDDEEDE